MMKHKCLPLRIINTCDYEKTSSFIVDLPLLMGVLDLCSGRTCGGGSSAKARSISLSISSSSLFIRFIYSYLMYNIFVLYFSEETIHPKVSICGSQSADDET